MSGIVARFERDGQAANGRLTAAMLQSIDYRGPDRLRVRHAGPVSLGHAKMAITPEDCNDWQPLVSPRTGCMLVADVRLDNRRDLLSRLPEPVSRMASDAELILRTYEAWGVDAPKYLFGDFAFIIWDPRTHVLFAARDTSGQRSLYYRVDARTFAAASEIHALLQEPSLPVRPNLNRIHDYLVPQNVRRNLKDGPSTFYDGVHSIPAGHRLRVTREAVHVEPYWEFAPPPELKYRNPDEYAEHYFSLLSDVVGSRLRTAAPIGALLSGGLDSSSIVCTAQELYRSGKATPSRFTSFTFVYEGLECDEGDLVRDIEALYDLDVRYIQGPAVGGWLQPTPLGFQEVPGMGIPELRDAVMRAATEAGTRVLLTGDGADTCVVGSPLVFDSLLRKGNFREFWRRLQAYRRTSSDTLRKILAYDCVAPLLPLAIQKRLMADYCERAIRRGADQLVPMWIAEPLQAELRERHLQLWLDLERDRRFQNASREDDYRLLYSPEFAQQPQGWSLEIWRPFADRRLHEFMLSVPPELKWDPQADTDDYYAASKQIVRRAMRGVLPESVRTRKWKTHFGSVFQDEIARQWWLYEAMFGPGSKSAVAEYGLVDADRFWARLTWLRAGVDGDDFGYLMRIVAVEAWLRGLRVPRPELVQVRRPFHRRPTPAADLQETVLTGRGSG